MKNEKTLAGVDNSIVTPEEVDNAEVRAQYVTLLEVSENANLDAFEFANYLNNAIGLELTSITQATKTMKGVLKDSPIKPAILPSHVQHIPTLVKMVDALPETVTMPIGKALGLAHRLDAWKGVANAAKIIGKADSFEQLNEQTPSKAEITAINKGESQAQNSEIIALGVTLEGIVDMLGEYLTKQDLKTLKTVELVKLESVISRLVTVAKNSKVA